MDCHLPMPPPNLGSELAMSVPGMLDTAGGYRELGGGWGKKYKEKEVQTSL